MTRPRWLRRLWAWWRTRRGLCAHNAKGLTLTPPLGQDAPPGERRAVWTCGGCGDVLSDGRVHW